MRRRMLIHLKRFRPLAWFHPDSFINPSYNCRCNGVREIYITNSVFCGKSAWMTARSLLWILSLRRAFNLTRRLCDSLRSPCPLSEYNPSLIGIMYCDVKARKVPRNPGWIQCIIAQYSLRWLDKGEPVVAIRDPFSIWPNKYPIFDFSFLISWASSATMRSAPGFNSHVLNFLRFSSVPRFGRRRARNWLYPTTRQRWGQTRHTNENSAFIVPFLYGIHSLS